MKSTLLKKSIFLALVLTLTLTLGACDFMADSHDPDPDEEVEAYEVTVVVEGISSEEHAEEFSLILEGDHVGTSEDIDSGDFVEDENEIRTTVDLEGDVDMTLSDEGEVDTAAEFDGEYERLTYEESLTADDDGDEVEFEVDFTVHVYEDNFSDALEVEFFDNFKVQEDITALDTLTVKRDATIDGDGYDLEAELNVGEGDTIDVVLENFYLQDEVTVDVEDGDFEIIEGDADGEITLESVGAGSFNMRKAAANIVEDNADDSSVNLDDDSSINDYRANSSSSVTGASNISRATVNSENVKMSGQPEEIDEDSTHEPEYAVLEEIDADNESQDVTVTVNTSESEVIDELPANIVLEDDLGGRNTVDIDWEIEDYDSETPGEYDATGSFDIPDGVEQPDDELDLEVSVTVEVIGEGELNVTDVTVEPEEVDTGDEVDVIADLENAGGEDVEQDVELTIEWGNGDADDYTATEEDVSVDAGESLEVEFEDITVDEAAGEGVFRVKVATEDDSATTQLTVGEVALNVTDVTVDPAEVKPEEEFDVTADIENEGEEDAVEDVELTVDWGDVDDYTETAADVEIDGGDKITVEFTDIAVPEDIEAGSYDVDIDVGDAFGSTEVTVEKAVGEPDELSLSVSDDELEVGDEITLTATVEDEDGLAVEGVEVDFSGGEGEFSETTVETDTDGEATADYTADENDVNGDITLTAQEQVNDNKDFVDITVEEKELDPAEFRVSRVSVDPESVDQGGEIDVTARVRNIGDQDGSQDIELAIDWGETGTVETEDTVSSFSVDAGDREDVVFNDIVVPSDAETGEAEIEVASDDDDALGSVSVAGDAYFEVTDVDVDPLYVKVFEDVDASVTAKVENVGALKATQDISLEVDGSKEVSDSITLDAGESEKVTFEYDVKEFEQTDVGEKVSFNVISENDNQEVDLEVDDEALVSTEGELENALDEEDISTINVASDITLNNNQEEAFKITRGVTIDGTADKNKLSFTEIDNHRGVATLIINASDNDVVTLQNLKIERIAADGRSEEENLPAQGLRINSAQNVIVDNLEVIATGEGMDINSYGIYINDPALNVEIKENVLINGFSINDPVYWDGDHFRLYESNEVVVYDEALFSRALSDVNVSTIILGEDYSHDGNLVSIDRNLTIEGNGQFINAGFDIDGGAQVAISDLTIENISEHGFSSQSTVSSEIILNSVIDGKLTLDQVTMSHSKTTRGEYINLVGVNVRGNGELDMDNSTLNLTNESFVYGVYGQANGPIIDMTNNTFNAEITPDTLDNRAIYFVGHEIGNSNTYASINLTDNDYNVTIKDSSKQSFYELMLYAGAYTENVSDINTYIDGILTSGETARIWYPSPTEGWYNYPDLVHNTTSDLYYSEIQPAIDDANANDEIDVAAGTYEGFIVDKNLTLLGPNNGTAYDGSRDVESVINGSISMESNTDVTIDGFEIEANVGSQEDVIEGRGGNIRVEIANSIITANGYGDPSRIIYINGGFTGEHSLTSPSKVTLNGNKFTGSNLSNGLGVGMEIDEATIDNNEFVVDTDYAALEIWTSGDSQTTFNINNNVFTVNGTGDEILIDSEAYSNSEQPIEEQVHFSN